MSFTSWTVDTGWNSSSGWRIINTGNTAGIDPASTSHLTSTNGDVTRMARVVAPRAPFTVQFLAGVLNYTMADPVSGVSFGTKVDTGRGRLMLALQSDCVYAMTGATTWTRVYAATGDTAWHTWTVEVDAAGGALLYGDGPPPVSSGWTLPASPGTSTTGGRVVEHWVDVLPSDDSVADVTSTLVR